MSVPVPVLVQLVLATTCLLQGSPSALGAAALLLVVAGLQLADRWATRRSQGVGARPPGTSASVATAPGA